MLRLKNSTTPRTSPASVTGNANAACKPSSSPPAARGKFVSEATSGIHAGRRSSHTRPGSPVPFGRRRFALLRRNRGPVAGVALQPPTNSSTPASSSTRHIAPTSHPRASPMAAISCGVASSSVEAVDSARPMAYNTTRPRSASLRRRSLSSSAASIVLRSDTSTSAPIVPKSSPRSSCTGVIESRIHAPRGICHSVSHASPSRMRFTSVSAVCSFRESNRTSPIDRPIVFTASIPSICSARRFHRVTTAFVSVATTADPKTSNNSGSSVSGHNERTPSRAARSISNHTVVGAPGSTPQRSATRSTRTRPHPPASSRPVGAGGSTPTPSSASSTRRTSSRNPIRSARSAPTSCGPWRGRRLTLARSRAASRPRGPRAAGARRSRRSLDELPPPSPAPSGDVAR